MPLSAVTEKDFRARTFEEARKRFAGKVPLTSEEFDKLAGEQKRRAFRIAEVNNARLIQDVFNKLERAVKEGSSFRDWRNELLKLFDTEGVPPPAMHRLQLAFRQNMLQSYSDARRKMLDEPDIARAFPYRMYMTVGNGTPGYKNVRREHAALHGLVFRWDDAFWQRYTPPWDYNCRCTFIPLTENEVKRRRLKVRGLGHVVRKLKIKPHPDFGAGKSDELDLSGLREEIRKAVEESLK